MLDFNGDFQVRTPSRRELGKDLVGEENTISIYTTSFKMDSKVGTGLYSKDFDISSYPSTKLC